MGMIINTQSNSDGVFNKACGQIVTDAVAAAAQTITLGFVPRKINFVNLTDRISDEWFEGIEESMILVNLRGINAKLDADGGVTPTDFAATCNPASADLSVMRTALIALLTKLDASAGVTDTDYAALWRPAVPTVAALVASINGMNAKLDADAGVTDVDYASIWNVSTSPSLHTVANGTRTFELTNGIAVSGSTFTLTATTMVASKQFYWTAEG